MDDTQQPTANKTSGFDDFPKEWRPLNLAFRASRTTEDELRAAQRLQFPPPQSNSPPPWALSRDSNTQFPLINQQNPPFPFVNPATVMAPTVQEAHPEPPRAAPPRLPTVLLRNFSANGLRRTDDFAVCKSPQRPVLVLKVHGAFPQPQTAAAGEKMPPPPPPHTSKKRKRDE